MRHRLALALCALLLLAGVASFVALDGAVRDFDQSVSRFYRRTDFADFVADGGDNATFAARARALPGVAAIETRTFTTLAVWIRRGKEKVQGRVVGVPDGRPAVNRLVIRDGHGLRGGTRAETVAESHTADDFRLRPGDTVTALGIGSSRDLRVVGAAYSPEYLTAAASQQQLITARGSFAVLFVPQSIAERLGGVAGVPQVLVRYRDGANDAATTRQLERLALDTHASLHEARPGQPSNAVVIEERTGFREASLLGPWMLLLTAVAVTTLVIGPSARRLATSDADASMRSLLGAVLAPALTGTVLGAILGVAGQRIVAERVSDSLALPSFSSDIRIVPIVVGVAFGLLAGGIAVGLALLTRREWRKTGRSGVDAGLGVLTAAGVALALVVVLGPAGMIDSVEQTLTDAGRLERVDAQVAFGSRVDPADLRGLHDIKGVSTAEAVPSANVVVSHGSRNYTVSFEAFDPETQLHRFEHPDGTTFRLPDRGVVLPAALADLLDARVGQDIELAVIGAELPPARIRVASINSNTLGNIAFTSIAGIRAALGEGANTFAGGLFNTAALSQARNADPRGVERDVTRINKVQVYVPVSDDLDVVAGARPVLRIATLALLGLGAVVAALTLIAIGVAAPSAFWQGLPSTRRLVLVVLVPMIAGIAAGAVLGTLVANRLVDALQSSLVHLNRTVTPVTYVLAILAQVVVLAFAVTLGHVAERRSHESTASAT